jgi:16S rRNA (adenine1518-N6/adenine1519-N6)-dimethyltransferase
LAPNIEDGSPDGELAREDPERGGVIARLRRAGIRPRKGLGQHFLHDSKILAGIAEAGDIGADEVILEIGTGPGTLTRELSARAGRVITVDVDPVMIRFARKELRGRENVRFIEMDALDGKGSLNPDLRQEIEALGSFKLVSNLPYSIATPLLLSLFESRLPIRLAAVTLQKELAARLGARPSTRDYGPATVLLAFWARVEPVRVLPPGAFWPPPAVSSEVIRIVPHPAPIGEATVYPSYSWWAHRLFSQRRKQVGGLLREILGADKAVEALNGLGIQAQERPDRIHPNGYLLLAKTYGFSGFQGES